MEREVLELERKYADLESEFKAIEDRCAKEGLSYNEMLKEANSVLIKMTNVDREIRLKRTPSIDYKNRSHGKRITLDEFIEGVNNEIFTDSNGFGKYAGAQAVSDISIYPSDITADKYRTDFSHVLWLEK